MITRIELIRQDGRPAAQRWLCKVEGLDMRYGWWSFGGAVCRWKWCAFYKARRNFWKQVRAHRREVRETRTEVKP